MKLIPNGTEVLIFKYIREWGPNQNEISYITGVVQSSELSDDLSCHGSLWTEYIYNVLGIDGKTYIGTYGSGLIGNSFFRTKEDQIKYLMRKINDNNQNITNLEEENNSYFNEISIIQGMDRKENLKDNPKVKTLIK